MRLLLILFIVVYSGYSFAHKDTGLELQYNGTLIGLPNKYEPSSFDLKSFNIEVAGKKLLIPECIRRKVGINNRLNYSIDFNASWYHNSTTLPPYMNIIVTPEKGDFYYSLLLNLDTLGLIGAKKMDKATNVVGFVHLRRPIEFTEQCLRSFKLATAEINT
jgi:hypothetical protein